MGVGRSFEASLRECVYVLFMFLIQDGTSFKSKYKFAPYFYAATKASLYN